MDDARPRNYEIYACHSQPPLFSFTPSSSYINTSRRPCLIIGHALILNDRALGTCSRTKISAKFAQDRRTRAQLSNMSLSPTPDTPFTTPINSFSISPDYPRQLKKCILPSLRVKITAKMLVPAQWSPTKGRKPRGLEGEFQVVLPVGGKVKIELKVEETGLDLVTHPPECNGPESSSGGDGDTECSENIQTVAQFATTSLRRLLISVCSDTYQIITLSAEQRGHRDRQGA